MTLVVLAAGMGSRYGGLKQLDPMTPHGEFIIDFSVYDALRAGYNKVVFIIKKENYDQFRETIGHRIEKVIDVEYAFQGFDWPAGIGQYFPADRVKPLGTAHALLCARDAVQEKFSVINADDYYGPTAYDLAHTFLRQSADGHFCMVGYDLVNTLTENGTVSRGICLKDQNDLLLSITERTKIMHNEAHTAAQYEEGGQWSPLPYNSIASMNFFGMDPTVFDFVEEGLYTFLQDPQTDKMKGEYFLPSAISAMRAAGKCDLRVLRTGDQWHGVTYPADKAEVVAAIQKKIAAGVYPDGLWQTK